MTSFEEQFYEQLLEIQAIPSGPIDGHIDVITNIIWRVIILVGSNYACT
jgi:hypothetical protein